MNKLVIEDDEGKAVVVPLVRDEITLGRREGNTIRLTERNVSRRHARLVRREGGYFVEDLTSHTGTRVNGVPISGAVPLNNGDQIAIGDYKLGLNLDGAAAGATGGEAAQAPAAPPPAAAPRAPAPPPAMAVPPIADNAPAEPMEGSPTIPVRTLAEQGLADTAQAPPARLVAMTAPLAGQEFALDRASLVLGRTLENDIVLNHKSISRHHAKIIRDGEQYVVVDLESANGVRVNGAEYERIELQPGDVLQLGHVRLRFVTGDDIGGYDFDAYGMASKKRFIIGGGVAAVAVIAVVAMVFSGKDPDKDKSARPTAGTVSATTPAAAPAPVVDSPAALLAKAREAVKREKWDEALALLGKATAQGPMIEADEVRRVAEAEKQNEPQFVSLQRLAQGGDHEGVLKGSEAIPEGSVYKARAQEAAAQARSKVVTQRLAAAEAFRDEGKCDEAKQEAAAVLAIEPENAAAQDVQNRCKKAAKPAARPAPRVAAARPSRAPPPPVRPTFPRAVVLEPAAAPAGDPDLLMKDAQDAWIKGQHAAAIDAARRAVRLRPSLTHAYQIIAVCSCALRDAAGASKAYERLESRYKSYVKQACQKNGVTLN